MNRCECGAAVEPRGKASHLRGRDHDARMTCAHLRREGWVELPGTTRGTAAALQARGFAVVAFPHWRAGGIRQAGRFSVCVGVKPHDALRLTFLPDMPEAAVAGARVACPLVDRPMTVEQSIVDLTRRLARVRALPLMGHVEHDLRVELAVLEDMRHEAGGPGAQLEHALFARRGSAAFGAY